MPSMNDGLIPTEFAKQLAEFPPPLVELVAEELRAGNSILAMTSGHPAAPCGACVRLAQPVQSERRVSTSEVKFYERNNCSHAGEFTTAERYFFVLEPPRPPEPEPDMDAIREEMRARERAEDERRFRETYY
ncbi:MAG: hypothetical protein JNL67_04805 [Planctomycetaceae bacterium]|nr:hypothetical protein [Planctomycetaceae bacterium]